VTPSRRLGGLRRSSLALQQVAEDVAGSAGKVADLDDGGTLRGGLREADRLGCPGYPGWVGAYDVT
jgi:hypothetical protein